MVQAAHHPRVFFTLIYAASDEWHQTFVFGRSGTVMDVFIDSVGSLLGALTVKGYGQKN